MSLLKQKGGGSTATPVATSPLLQQQQPQQQQQRVQGPENGSHVRSLSFSGSDHTPVSNKGIKRSVPSFLPSFLAFFLSLGLSASAGLTTPLSPTRASNGQFLSSFLFLSSFSLCLSVLSFLFFLSFFLFSVLLCHLQVSIFPFDSVSFSLRQTPQKVSILG